MSRTLETDTGQMPALSTTSARLVAVKLKSANKSIFRALLSLASANLLIRVAGLVNTVIVSARFGIGIEMDAYFVASALPILFAQLLASALEASVIPVYAHIRTRRQNEKATRLFSTLLNLIVISTVLMLALMFLFREQLLRISAPGTSPGVLALTIGLAPLVFPVFILTLLNNFMEYLLNAEGKFGWPAYAGMLVPFTTVIFVLLLGDDAGPYGGIFALGLGTLVGQTLQLVAIIIRAVQVKITYRPVLDLSSPEMKKVAIAAGPALLGGMLGLMTPLIDQIFASYQSSGTIAALNNALKLNSVPTGVIFAAVGRAALPYLASQAAIKDMQAFKGTLRLYLWAITIVTLVLTVVMTVGAQPIVMLLFYRGTFTMEDVNLTAATLAGFSIGLTPMAIGFFVARAFSALGKTRILMITTIFTVFANTLFNAIFGSLWQSFGLAFATSLYYFCTMIILLVGMRHTIGKLDLFTPPPELHKVLLKLGIGPITERVLAQGIGPHQFYKKILRWCTILVVFGGGIFGTLINASLMMRAALGMSVILALLSNPYWLLLAWGGINVFIGSSLPFFNGNNLTSGLLLPTFLLLFHLSVKETFKRMVALPFLFAFLLWELFSIGISPVETGYFLTTWTLRLAFAGVAVLAILTITTRKKFLVFIDVMIVPAIFIAIYGLIGFLQQRGGVLDDETGFFRISSIFSDSPPTLAIYLTILIPLTVYRLTTLRGIWKLAGGFVVLFLLLLALGLTFSRGPLAVLPVGAFLIIPLIPGRKTKGIMLSAFLTVGGLVMLITTLLNIPLFSRFLNGDLMTLNGRTRLWEALLDHYDPYQLLGQGLKSADHLLEHLQVGFGGGVIATAAHNIFLEALYEHGFIGLTLLILTFLVMGGGLIYRWVKTRNRDLRFLIAATFWCYLNVLIQCIESNDIWNTAIGVCFFLFMALPFARYWSEEPEQQDTAGAKQKGSESEGTTTKHRAQGIGGASTH